MSERDPENDELWELLGKARRPEVSPFFARNVVRAARQTGARPSAGWLDLLRRWQVAGLAVALLVTGLLIRAQFEPAALSEPVAAASISQEISASPDYEVIVNLEDLLAYDENSVWLDSSNTF